ncbi:MAG: NADH dehydrogenase FAD-containing subunit [Planctomycetes bacterium]|nr:NADH dehydrogenase FAD-containing subunit [Planctomycetota bacterium]
MLWAVVIIPAAAALAAMAPPLRRLRAALLAGGALAHAGAVGWLCLAPPPATAGAWLALDAPGRVILAVTSGLFLVVALYAVGYLRAERPAVRTDIQEGFLFRNEPEGVFVACLLGFLATMSLVCVSSHLGLLWVAIEATTLVSAPLISFHRHHRSLEATWKYLLICSVGIALALLGVFFLAAAAGDGAHGLTLDALLAAAGGMDPTLLKAAFIFLLVGYGTKMGLAPMHTWLPDAHSEAPSLVSALLSGALLNCAFLGLLRGHAVLVAAHLGDFSGELLVLLGLVSMGAAAVFLIRQCDYKRMLAYSSIEHMGILALGVGLGGLAATGAMLHAVNHSLAKGLLFLTAGNLLAIYRTKTIGQVQGVLRRAPVNGALWLAGFFAIAGSPPFGLFISELTILKGAMDGGHWTVAVLYLLLLGMIFVAMARLVLPMAFGEAPQPSQPAREPAWAVAPPLVLGAGALVLGLYVPGPLWNALADAAAAVGVH